jgi:hypothetical protein
MPQYLLSVYQPDGDAPPPEILQPIVSGVLAWEARLKAAGAWVFTAGLRPASSATVLRTADGEVAITDGPYTEGKEHLGGFTVISAGDLDAAMVWGQQLAEITTLPIEIRPLQGDDS